MRTAEQRALYQNGNNGSGSGRKSPYRLEERATGLFLFGIVLFNPLMLSVFDRGADVVLLSVPLLFIYTFCAWAMLIILLACTVKARVSAEEPPDDEPKGSEPPPEIP